MFTTAAQTHAPLAPCESTHTAARGAEPGAAAASCLVPRQNLFLPLPTPSLVNIYFQVYPFKCSILFEISLDYIELTIQLKAYGSSVSINT